MLRASAEPDRAGASARRSIARPWEIFAEGGDGAILRRIGRGFSYWISWYRDRDFASGAVSHGKGEAHCGFDDSLDPNKSQDRSKCQK